MLYYANGKASELEQFKCVKSARPLNKGRCIVDLFEDWIVSEEADHIPLIRGKEREECDKKVIRFVTDFLQKTNSCILTGSRKILGKTNRDWDFALIKVPVQLEWLPWRVVKPNPGTRKVSAGPGHTNYFDPTVKEVWKLDLGVGYEYKVDIQVCRDEMMWAEKAGVTEFLASKDNDDIESVKECFGWAHIWRELLFPSDYNMNPIWDRMLAEATTQFQKQYMN